MLIPARKRPRSFALLPCASGVNDAGKPPRKSMTWFISTQVKVVGSILPVIGGCLAAFLIGAAFFVLLVRIATRLGGGFFPRWGPACLACFLGWLAAYVGGIVLGFAASLPGKMGWHSGSAVLGSVFGGHSIPLFTVPGVAAIALFVKPPIYRALLKSPEGARMGPGKSFLVAAIELVIVVLIYAAALLLLLFSMHAQM